MIFSSTKHFILPNSQSSSKKLKKKKRFELTCKGTLRFREKVKFLKKHDCITREIFVIARSSFCDVIKSKYDILTYFYSWNDRDSKIQGSVPSLVKNVQRAQTCPVLLPVLISL